MIIIPGAAVMLKSMKRQILVYFTHYNDEEWNQVSTALNAHYDFHFELVTPDLQSYTVTYIPRATPLMVSTGYTSEIESK